MKLFYILSTALLYAAQGLAQTDSVATPNPDSTVDKASLTLGTSYSNNANYYGQKAIESVPYAAVAATYKLKCGLYFTGLAYKLLHDSTHAVSAASAGAGLNFKLIKHLSADVSYSHTFYPALSPLLQAGNPDNASASLLLENWLSSKINLDYAFGKTADYFVTAGTAKQITLGHITSKDLITITPAVDIVAGTQHFYQTYLTEKKLRDSVLHALLGPVIGQPSTEEPTTKTTVSTQFNLLSYNFKCPLAYNRAHYLVEVAYQLSVLSSKAQSNAGKANQFISASFYYQF
ncbi:MAG: hypothetical protein ABJB86_17020 [Bacteroidota bacterium]